MAAQPPPFSYPDPRVHPTAVVITPCQLLIRQCEHAISMLSQENQSATRAGLHTVLLDKPSTWLRIGRHLDGSLLVLERLYADQTSLRIQLRPVSGSSGIDNWQHVRSFSDLDSFPQSFIQFRPSVASKHSTPDGRHHPQQILRPHPNQAPGARSSMPQHVPAPVAYSAHPSMHSHLQTQAYPQRSSPMPSSFHDPGLHRHVPLNSNSGVQIPHSGLTNRPSQAPMRPQRQPHVPAGAAQPHQFESGYLDGYANSMGAFHGQSNGASFPVTQAGSHGFAQNNTSHQSAHQAYMREMIEKLTQTHSVAHSDNYQLSASLRGGHPISSETMFNLAADANENPTAANNFFGLHASNFELSTGISQQPGVSTGTGMVFDNQNMTSTNYAFRPETEFEQPAAKSTMPGTDTLNDASESQTAKRAHSEASQSSSKRRPPPTNVFMPTFAQIPVDSPQEPVFPTEPTVNIQNGRDHATRMEDVHEPDVPDSSHGSSRKSSMGHQTSTGPQPMPSTAPHAHAKTSNLGPENVSGSASSRNTNGRGSRPPLAETQPRPAHNDRFRNQHSSSSGRLPRMPDEPRKRGRPPKSEPVPLPEFRDLDDDSHKAALLSIGKEELNHYEVLRVKMDADKQEIRKAFHKLSLLYHPDRNGGDELATTRMKKLNTAYEVILDDKQRKAYDAELLGQKKQRPLRPKQAPTT